MFLAWLSLITANLLMGRGFTGLIHFEIMLTLAMVLFIDIVYSTFGEKRHNTLRIGILILIGIEVTRSIGTLYSNPRLVRDAMSQSYATLTYVRASLFSVGTYDLYTGMALVFPIMLAMTLKQTGFWRVVLFAFLIIIATSIVLSTLMGATLILVCGTLLLGLLMVPFGKNRFGILLLFLLIGVISFFVWTKLLSSTSQAEYVINKFNTITASVLNRGLLQGDITARANLWLMSWYTFLQNPWFGIGPATGANNPYMGFLVGGHSDWLDIPAEYGLLGLSFFSIFIYQAMKRILRPLLKSKDMLSMAYLVACICFLIAGSYNPIVFSYGIVVLFFILASGKTDNTIGPEKQNLHSRSLRS